MEDSGYCARYVAHARYCKSSKAWREGSNRGANQSNTNSNKTRSNHLNKHVGSMIRPQHTIELESDKALAQRTSGRRWAVSTHASRMRGMCEVIAQHPVKQPPSVF